MKRIHIPGPQGRIEALWSEAPNGGDGTNTPAAVILPPDPRFGADADSRIVHAAFTALVKRGFSVITLNYAGIGASDGRHTAWDIESPLEDAYAAVDWISARHCGTGGLWVAGVGLGSYLATQVAPRRPESRRTILISATPNLHDYATPLALRSTPVTIVHGTADTVCPLDAVQSMVGDVMKATPKRGDIRIFPIKGGDHSQEQHLGHVAGVVGHVADEAIKKAA